jgi:hypothetical protein
MAAPDSATSSFPRTRRAFLLGGIAAAAGLVADAVRPHPVLAADDDPIILGNENFSQSITEVKSSGDNTFAFIGEATAVIGLGVGVMGISRADEGTGLWGVATQPTGSNQGVLARSHSSAGTGLFAHASAASGETIAVDARADSPHGIAVLARNLNTLPRATALKVEGNVRFSTAGIDTIPKGADRVTVETDFQLTGASKILCTLQSDPGGRTSLQRVVKNAAFVFTIVLTADATAATRVAWFVIA